MRAGPLKSVHHPLQIGDLVLLRVAPRCGHVALIEDRQGPGDATSSRGCFAALKKDLPERRPGGLLLEEGVKAAQIGDRSSDSEAFCPGIGLSPQHVEHGIGPLPFLVAVDLHVEAPSFRSACRGIPDLHLVP